MHDNYINLQDYTSCMMGSENSYEYYYYLKPYTYKILYTLIESFLSLLIFLFAIFSMSPAYASCVPFHAALLLLCAVPLRNK